MTLDPRTLLRHWKPIAALGVLVTALLAIDVRLPHEQLLELRADDRRLEGRHDSLRAGVAASLDSLGTVIGELSQLLAAQSRLNCLRNRTEALTAGFPCESLFRGRIGRTR